MTRDRVTGNRVTRDGAKKPHARALKVTLLALLFGGWVGATMLLASPASARVFEVGAGKPHATLSEVAEQLNPGDLVLLSGGATYPGGIVFSRPGEAERPIIVRGVPVDGRLPVLSGGTNTLEVAADHYVFENLELTGGSYRCFFHRGHNITLRASRIHDCPAHGILGADEGSGTLLLEYSELYHCGNGTRHHTIYMATDQARHPGSVFRMQHNYVHDTRGGNAVKSRAERNEIYFNWIEGALYHELELIGPDGQDHGRVREDSDVVGNVLRKTNDAYTIRIGGDGTGDTAGRYRFVNNTFLLAAAARPVFRLFDRIQSLEQHNNLFWREGGAPVVVFQDEHVKWTEGRPLVVGINNWVPTGSSFPEAWFGTLQGADPGLVDLAKFDLRPAQGSPLVDAGALAIAGPSGFELPAPLTAISSSPPPRRGGVSYLRETDGRLDIGAYEGGFALQAMLPLPKGTAGNQPLNPLAPPSDTAAQASNAEPPPPAVPPSAGRCGCRTPGAGQGTSALWALGLVVFGLARRRRGAGA